ncbi:MAG: NADH-quinone oxidoreductase subunit C [Promethearchaeota archaeon]
MISIPELSHIGNNLKDNFKKDIRKHGEEPYGYFISINRAIIRDIAIYLHDHGANFINIFANDMGEKFELFYEYFMGAVINEKKYIFVRTEVDKKAGEIDSIEIVFPQALRIEKELEKRYGIRFILFSEELEKGLFVIPHHLPEKDFALNMLPLGIFNKVHLSSNYFSLQLDKFDNIVAVSQRTGWLYRGITELLKKKNLFTENLKLTKRICYPSSFHHNLAYIMAVEQLLEIELNERIKLIRTFLCELERYENTIIFFANLFFLLGYKNKYFSLLKAREELLNIYRECFDIRFLDDLNLIGGCKNISAEQAEYVNIRLIEFLNDKYELINQFIFRNYILNRCGGIGVLEKKDALDSGVTGHCLRGSGIRYDIRYEKPYLSYNDKYIAKVWDVATSDECDVMGRILVKLFDMSSSIRIIQKVSEKLMEDDLTLEVIDFSTKKLPADKIAIAQVESPTGGELTYYLKTADRPGKVFLGGVYISTPSLKNFLALNDYILKGNNVKDFNLIVHSMDLNFHEIDL